METASRIRLSPPDAPQPQTACIPLAHARRWHSPFDDGSLEPVVAVFVTQTAYSHVCAHAGSKPDYEVGGVLVGKWCVDADNNEQFVVVEKVLPARYTRQGSVYLTFTQDSLVNLHNEFEKHFQGKRIVGWYHTHPRMGVFLSDYDTWLHGHFFPEPWQVALVIEPHSATGGFFIRQAGGGLDPARHFGFYELNGHLGHSVVHWRNLQVVGEEIGSEGG